MCHVRLSFGVSLPWRYRVPINVLFGRAGCLFFVLVESGRDDNDTGPVKDHLGILGTQVHVYKRKIKEYLPPILDF